MSLLAGDTDGLPDSRPESRSALPFGLPRELPAAAAAVDDDAPPGPDPEGDDDEEGFTLTTDDVDSSVVFKLAALLEFDSEASSDL